MASGDASQFEIPAKLCEGRESFGSGDTYLVLDALPTTTESTFDQVLGEVRWHEMRHKGGRVPREVAIQGTLREDSPGELLEPVYRHPADEQPKLVPWTPVIARIKAEIEELLTDGAGELLNHALVQLYRNGWDFIGEHSDKTLDIKRGANIVNYSLGATRLMVLKHKETGIRQRISLPSNSLLIMGWRTNREWLHEIRPDKRPLCEKSAEELAFDGRRISLTFRTIATFRERRSGRLSGQGVPRKLLADPNQQERLSQEEQQKQQMELLMAFSAENKMGSQFDWDEHYGRGFDVLNFKLVNSAGL